MTDIVGRFSNGLLSLCAGASSFTFTLLACLLLQDANEQLVASLFIGLFALLVVWVAAERPNSGHARAVSALIDRLLAVETGDLSSPAPAALRQHMPKLASAVEGLFKQVQSNLANVHAMAMFDPVTSLPNRINFKREADRILKSRNAGDPLALLFIDLDGFKEVNDSMGHAAGDAILKLVADRLSLGIRREVEEGQLFQPVLARLAGDEFTLLFPVGEDPASVEAIARRILDGLCEPFDLEGQKIEMGASIGIALCPEHGTELPSLMKAADIAMYQAKANGRSQVCVFDRQFAAEFESKARIERQLRHALARSEFDLAFHPQICLKDDSVVAGEALVRWHHPQDGLKLPGSFIPIAEESSLITEIGEWIADAAAQTLARLAAEGMTKRLALNISARQLDRADFFVRLRQSVKEAGAPLGMLELEFTESLAMRCSNQIMGEFAILQSEGVSITIDDFGAGYSNFARLKNMPVDRVKLDVSLTRDVDTNPTARTIVAAVVHLVHGLGAEVVAEGVERPEQLDVLRALGCDHVQGFLFAEPMVEADFARWISARENDRPAGLVNQPNIVRRIRA